MTLWKKSGTLLLATGIIHNAVGLMMGWKILASIADAGFINTIKGENELDRSAIFWFLFSGFLMMLLGKFMQDYIEEHNRPAPAYIGYYLLILTIIGCLIMPISGFWIVLPQVFIIIYANQKVRMAEV